MSRTTIGFAATAVSVALGLLVIALSVQRGVPAELTAGVLIVLVALGLAGWVTRQRPRTLATIAALGWTAQVVTSLLYYYLEFGQDAVFFFGETSRLIESGEPLVFPTGNWGNEGVVLVTRAIFAVTGPGLLTGYVAFAAIAVAGKTLFARMMLGLLPLLGRPAEVVAVAVMVYPSLTWWLSAISKEALVILGTGIALHAAIRTNDRAPSIVGIGAGLAVIALVRAHIALVLAAGIYVYLFSAFTLPYRRGGRRPWTLLAGALVVVTGLSFGARYLGGEGFTDLEDARMTVAGRAPEGGSGVQTRPITSPADVPQATFTLLFRPTLLETFNLVTVLQAIESTLLAGFLVWLAVQGRRRRRRPRWGADRIKIRALRVFAVAYAGAFIFSMSAVAYNLGLVSRQRIQMLLPLLLLYAAAMVHVRRGPGPSRTAAPAAPAGPAGVTVPAPPRPQARPPVRRGVTPHRGLPPRRPRGGPARRGDVGPGGRPLR